jgi:hypothetical protein
MMFALHCTAIVVVVRLWCVTRIPSLWKDAFASPAAALYVRVRGCAMQRGGDAASGNLSPQNETCSTIVRPLLAAFAQTVSARTDGSHDGSADAAADTGAPQKRFSWTVLDAAECTVGERAPTSDPVVDAASGRGDGSGEPPAAGDGDASMEGDGDADANPAADRGDGDKAAGGGRKLWSLLFG